MTRRADDVYTKLTARYPNRVLPVLSRLVQVSSASEEGGDTRRVVPLSELTEDEIVIVQEFANARLLVMSRTQIPC